MKRKMLDFSSLLEILSSVDTEIYDENISARENFVRQVSPVLQSLGIECRAIVEVCQNRTLSFQEILPLEKLAVDPAEVLANNIVKPSFRGSFPRRLRELYTFRVDYLLHVPKTGGQSLANNLLDGGFAVWDIDPDAHTDYVFSDLPGLPKKVSSSGFIFVHSHIFWTHIQEMLFFKDSDFPFCFLRNPRSIHVSNANYIYESINGREGGGQAKINSRWAFFLGCLGGEKSDSIVKILNSIEYKEMYSGIISKYLFGEFPVSETEVLLLTEAARRTLAFFDTSDVDDFLKSRYLIEEPRVFNSAKGESFDKEQVLRSVRWDCILGSDEYIYSSLIGR